jgi:hypothetical protein
MSIFYAWIHFNSHVYKTQHNVSNKWSLNIKVNEWTRRSLILIKKKFGKDASQIY